MMQLFYFSGSGNTELLARTLKQRLAELGAAPELLSISRTAVLPERAPERLVLLFPVYAFDAPVIVRRFLKRLPACPPGSGAKAFVIAAPGDPHWLNGSATFGVTRLLGKKGYGVVRREMIVMPSNFLIEYPDVLSRSLVRAALEKITATAGAILREEPAGLKARPAAHLVRVLSKIEHLGDNLFGKDLKAGASCNGCGRCVGTCPVGNISIRRGRIVFGWRCILCLKCVYRCPNGAVRPRLWSFVPLKNGYDPCRFSVPAGSGAGDGAGQPEARFPARFRDYLSGSSSKNG